MLVFAVEGTCEPSSSQDVFSQVGINDLYSSASIHPSMERARNNGCVMNRLILEVQYRVYSMTW